MRPETLNLGSEALKSFRDLFDISLRHALINMEEKDLQTGTITGKVKILIDRDVNRETGEMVTFISLKPDVNVKLGINAKAECEEVKGLHLAFDGNGDPIVSKNQISMDEYIRNTDERGA